MASRSMRQIVAEVFGMSQEKMEGMSTSRLDDLQVEAWAWQTVDEMLHVPIEFQGKPLPKVKSDVTDVLGRIKACKEGKFVGSRSGRSNNFYW